MCCCGKPTINGTPGYRWQPNDKPSTRPVDPPELAEGDMLLADEPGRCGGLDHHSHHYRLVKPRYSGGLVLLVRHGAGDERIPLGAAFPIKERLLALDSDARLWLLATLARVYRQGHDEGAQKTRSAWASAAAEKRIKLRRRGGAVVRVEIVGRAA